MPGMPSRRAAAGYWATGGCAIFVLRRHDGASAAITGAVIPHGPHPGIQGMLPSRVSTPGSQPASHASNGVAHNTQAHQGPRKAQ